MDAVFQLLNARWQTLQPFFSRILLENDLFYVTAGSVIRAALFYLLFWLIADALTRRSHRWIVKRYSLDNETAEWLLSFNRFILLILTTVIALLVAGLNKNALIILWNLTLFTFGDKQVDLGNIVFGIILLFPGLRMARTITREFNKIILNRTRMDDTAKNLFNTLFHYGLVIIFILFVMTIIGIPLTAFTVIGGALAIGVGLGSQNLVNNFLSGIILLVEHPMKVGDVVDVAGHKGTVEEIGGRATRIKTFDNLRVVIPNSKILEDNFVNWSLVDSYLRREINVGVAYGSDIQQAMAACTEIVSSHSLVERSPEPMILFTDFGDNALNICIYFWVVMGENVSPLKIESELREQIYLRFNSDGIVIAFPQRDVHLDAADPIRIKLEK